MMANDEKYTILYGRLSQEDDREGESNSIQNQRLILTKYAEEKGFENIRFLFDDGFSGTNFNRPSWNEIMELIESGQVETLIVKDMSRLGRDYLQTGFLMEHTFPNNNVRFIAINDAVDTLYEDNVLGRIPDEHYRTLSGEYTAEQKILRERIPKTEVRMDKLKSSLTNVDRFIEKAKKYTDLTELTPELLRMFIAKVVVGEKGKKYSRTAPQDIWIHYRDIGMLNDVKEEFDIPSMEEFYGMDDEMMFDDELQAAI